MSSLLPTFSFPQIMGLVGLTLGILTSSEVSSACDCAFPERIAPSSTDKNVPSNTKIWTTAFGCDAPILQKTDGTMVPLTKTKIEQITVLHPSVELDLGGTYELSNCGGFLAPMTFTVTQGPDTTPPPPPVFTLGETKASGGSWSSCGEELYVPINATFEGAVLVLDVAGRSTLDPKTITGDPLDVFFREDKPLVGDSICGPNNWNFEEDGDAVNTRLGAFDLAGNFSGMSAAQNVEAGCACSTVGATSTNPYGCALASLLVLGMASLRSRKR